MEIILGFIGQLSMAVAIAIGHIVWATGFFLLIAYWVGIWRNQELREARKMLAWKPWTDAWTVHSLLQWISHMEEDRKWRNVYEDRPGDEDFPVIVRHEDGTPRIMIKLEEFEEDEEFHGGLWWEDDHCTTWPAEQWRLWKKITPYVKELTTEEVATRFGVSFRWP